MTQHPTARAQTLVQTIQDDLGPVEAQLRQHAYFQDLDAGQIASQQLRYFVGEQWYIIPSDLRSIALLISRCETPASQQFFRDVLQGEAAALDALAPLAAAVGMSAADCEAYEPTPGAQAYSAYLAWLCLYGSVADVVTALSVNFAAWGANCGRMGQALQRQYGLPETAVRFFTQFATAPADPSPAAMQLMEAGLQHAGASRRMARAARMLQGYELMFWDTIYALSTHSERPA